jgi:hypothetical protein
MRNAPHGVEVWRREVVDDNDGAPIFAYVKRSTHRGLFSFLDARELEDWSGQAVEASARVPLAADVMLTDVVRIVGASGAVVGGWQVATLRPNRVHLRAMLRKAG